jgi:hypothetical protein
MSATKFRYLQNLGTPTSWDATLFELYRQAHLRNLPPRLCSLVANERYELDSRATMWLATLTSFQFSNSSFWLHLLNRWESTKFRFQYSGIKRVEFPPQKIYYPPEMVVQELTIVRGRLFRHVWSDTGGLEYEVVCSEIQFEETPIEGVKKSGGDPGSVG